MYSAKSLGRNQTYVFAEPDEDARVPRAPISPAGRALARSRSAGAARDAATAALDLGHRAPAPLPRPAVGAHRRRSSSTWPAASTCRRPRSTGSASPRCSTTSARSPSPRRSSRSRRRSPRPSGGPSSSIPRIGQVILEQAAALKDAVPIILHHHERYSGHGYPFGLRGNDIPLGARIVAIADAYDAMTHDRPYKRAIGHDAAIAELRRHAGTQFDPELVTLFCDLFAAAGAVAGPEVARDDHSGDRGDRHRPTSRESRAGRAAVRGSTARDVRGAG